MIRGSDNMSVLIELRVVHTQTHTHTGNAHRYDLAVRSPSRFCAVGAACGGGRPVLALAAANSHCDYRFFHADDDTAIGVDETEAVVDALEAVEGLTGVSATQMYA